MQETSEQLTSQREKAEKSLSEAVQGKEKAEARVSELQAAIESIRREAEEKKKEKVCHPKLLMCR